MIEVASSPTADTRTCDWSTVSRETLLGSSLSHIGDVAKGLGFFTGLLTEAAARHDFDKISDIDGCWDRPHGRTTSKFNRKGKP